MLDASDSKTMNRPSADISGFVDPPSAVLLTGVGVWVGRTVRVGSGLGVVVGTEVAVGGGTVAVISMTTISGVGVAGCELSQADKSKRITIRQGASRIK